MTTRTIEINMDKRCKCGEKGVGPGGLCFTCAAKMIGKMQSIASPRKGSRTMTPETAVEILGEAQSFDRQIAELDLEIADLKEQLKERKELRESHVAGLRNAVNRNTPLLDATGT